MTADPRLTPVLGVQAHPVLSHLPAVLVLEIGGVIQKCELSTSLAPDREGGSDGWVASAGEHGLESLLFEFIAV